MKTLNLSEALLEILKYECIQDECDKVGINIKFLIKIIKRGLDLTNSEVLETVSELLDDAADYYKVISFNQRRQNKLTLESTFDVYSKEDIKSGKNKKEDTTVYISMSVKYKANGITFSTDVSTFDRTTPRSLHFACLKDYAKKHAEEKVKMPFYDDDNDIYRNSNVNLKVLWSPEFKKLETLKFDHEGFGLSWKEIQKEYF